MLVATTLGAVVGPNLVTPLGALARTWNIPALAGPFLLAAVAYAAAGLVLWLLLHPDPLPAEAQPQVKADYWAMFDTAELDEPPGQKLVEHVPARIDAFADKYRPAYPSAAKTLLTDREQLTSYLRFPAEHHKRIRHSNLIERTFGETRRRVKVIGRLPGEASCLSLVWAVLDRASAGWRGLAMTPEGLRQLQDLRRSLFNPPTPLHRHAPPGEPENVSAAA